MEELLGLVADLIPDPIMEALWEAMPDWLRYLILTGILAFVGYTLWAFLR